MSLTVNATFSFGTSKTGLASGVRVQPLTSAHVATGAALSATITEIGLGMYVFSGSVPDDAAFLKGYHTTDATVLDVVAIGDDDESTEAASLGTTTRTTLRIEFRVNDTLTSATSAVVSDPTGTFGAKRTDTGATVVADGTAMTEVSTGVYEYTFDDPGPNLNYEWWAEIVYDGRTYRFEREAVGEPVALSTDLVRLSDAKSYLGISVSTYDTRLTALITAASNAIEEYCETEFASADYTEYLSGNGKGYLRTKNRPVTDISKIGLRKVGIEIINSSATNQKASVSLSSAGVLSLTRVASGTATTSSLTLSSYATLSALETAIEALGNGWEAIVPTDFADFPATDLKSYQGALNAKETAELYLYEPIYESYVWDETSGLIEGLYVPPGHLNVEIRYTAGYSTIPREVQTACAALVGSLFKRSERDQSLQSERLGDYSYSTLSPGMLASQLPSLSPDAAFLLQKYRAPKVTMPSNWSCA